MEAVRRHEVAGRQAGRADAVLVLADLADAPREHPYAQPLGPFGQCGLEDGPAGAETGPGPEPPLRVQAAHSVQVADPVERPARNGHAQVPETADRARHQALAARLVDRGGARLQHHDLHSGQRPVDGRGQPGRAAARDEQVDHRAPPSAGTGLR